MPELLSRDPIYTALSRIRTVAVLGAHDNPIKPAFYVPADLAQRGLQIIPINPRKAGQVLFGAPVLASLCDVRVPIDAIDVFRRAEALHDHIDEILSLSPRPALVWLQLGIRNPAFVARLSDAGMDVVQDRCLMIDYREWQHLAANQA